MRVTNSMIAGRVTYNTQNSITRFLKLQTQMSTGKKINKPSDDPLGITRDLDYRNELSSNRQYQNNINQAKTWYNTNEEVITTFHQFIDDAKNDAINGADDSFNAEGRQAFAAGIRSSIEQILALGNTQLEGRSIFSGHMTDVDALQIHPNGMTFHGDEGSIKYQIGSNQEVDMNMNGAELFFKQIKTLGEGFDLDPTLNSSTLLADLHNGNSVSQTPGQFVIRDLNLGIDTTIDVSAAATLDDVLTQINNDLIANGVSNVTARIADDKSSIMFETTQTGIITGTTPVHNLNNGAGVDVTSGLIRITDNAGIDFNIDLSSVVTITDVITEFNSQMSAAGISNVSMGINGTATGLVINDTNVIPLNLQIEDLPNNPILAEQLGITGAVGPTLVGADLAPQVHFAIEEMGGSTAEDLGILQEFKGNFVGDNLDVQLLATTDLSELNNGLGITQGEIVMWQGGNQAIVDLSDPSLATIQDVLDAFNNSGLDITASLNSDSRGIQVVSNDRYASFTIEDTSEGTAAKDLGIYGSSDVVGSFYVLANAMESNDLEAIGGLIENFENGLDSVLNNRAINASKEVRLESTEYRLLSEEFMFTSRLSELEDADLTKVITDLSIYENNYQAALLASAKIIQPSLMDFLR